MATATTATTYESRYGVKELLLILVAAALVVFTAWYVTHTSLVASKTYIIHETSQKPAPPKATTSTNTSTQPTDTATAPDTMQ